MARPSPVLPAAREREESPRANRSKTSGNRGGDARPVVDDGQDGVGVGRASASAGRPGRGARPGVCVRALASRFATTWCSRPGRRRP